MTAGERVAVTVEEVKHVLWRAGDLRWKLWSQQEPIYDGVRGLPRHIQHAVVLCARQFGKSYLGTLLAVEDCLRAKGSTVLVVGPTKEQTTDIVHQSIRAISEDAPPGLIRRSKSESRWYVGDSELVIGGFDAQNATRKRGRSLIKIYVEEVVDSNPDQYLESMRSDLGPALTHAKDAKMIFLTTLPKLTDHPFITETIPQAKLEDAFYSYTIDDNAALTPEQYEACVKRSGGRHSIEFRREYLNEIVRDANMMIVPDFDRTLHVKESQRPEHGHFATVIDFGGTRDKTVALQQVYDFKRDKLLFLDERAFDANTETKTIVTGIRDMERDIPEPTRWADCAGQLQIDLQHAHGFRVRLPLKDDWQASLNNMQLMFTQNRIEVHPRCKLLVATLESGQFNKQRSDFSRTSALGHCDALAAAMYGCRMASMTNPYPKAATPRDTMFVPPECPDDLTQASKMIQPKSFRNNFASDVYKPKRFGAFK